MMLHHYFILCAALLFTAFGRLQAQDIPDPDAVPQPKVIALAGLTTQWFDPRFKGSSFALERPVNRYYHVGIQANFFSPGLLNNNGFFSGSAQGISLDPGTFEVGLYYKCFFHGRLSGRKSNIYLGPDIRFGIRKYRDDYIFSGVQTPFKGRTTKYLVRLGMQWKIGNAILEVNLPMGVEAEKTDQERPSNDPFGYYYTDLNGSRFVMLPSFSLGYALYDFPKAKRK